MHNILKLIIIVCLVCGKAYAQPKRNITYETKLEVADQAAKDKDYYGAIEWFGKAYEESKDPSLQIAMADLYFLARDYNRAEKIYDGVLKRDKNNEYQDIRYDYGKVLKSQGKYKEAYAEFSKVLTNETLDDSITMMVKKELAGIDLLDKLADNLEVVVNYLPGKVNSGSAESAPAINPDGSLFFSSFNRKKKLS